MESREGPLSRTGVDGLRCACLSLEVDFWAKGGKKFKKDGASQPFHEGGGSLISRGRCLALSEKRRSGNLWKGGEDHPVTHRKER